MKMYTFVISIFVLSILIPQYGLAANSSAGKFKATMGDKIYDLDVTCDRFSKDGVMFRSDDKSGYREAKDTNGDNIAVYGQGVPVIGEGLSMSLQIYDNGKIFLAKTNKISKPMNIDIKMSGNTLTGKGKIIHLETMTNPRIEFTLTCE
jgi:hypothetical protein